MTLTICAVHKLTSLLCIMIFSINICTSYGHGVLANIFIIVQLYSKIIIIERFHASSVVDEHIIIKLIMQLDLRRIISRKKERD